MCSSPAPVCTPAPRSVPVLAPWRLSPAALAAPSSDVDAARSPRRLRVTPPPRRPVSRVGAAPRLAAAAPLPLRPTGHTADLKCMLTTQPSPTKCASCAPSTSPSLRPQRSSSPTGPTRTFSTRSTTRTAMSRSPSSGCPKVHLLLPSLSLRPASLRPRTRGQIHHRRSCTARPTCRKRTRDHTEC